MKSGNDLVFNKNGSYTIPIDSSSGQGDANHIQSSILAKQLLIRNNLGDWVVEKPDKVSVELLDDVVGQTAIDEAAIILQAQLNLQESIIDYGVGALRLKTMTNPVNELSSSSQSSTLGTLTTQASLFGHFQLNAEEAIVVTLDPGSADHFVLPVTDLWLVTVDPGNRQVSLNSEQSIANANGTYTFVVSIQDPSVYNWVEAAGLHEGTIMVRWQGLLTPLSSLTNAIGITLQVVQLSQLTSALPNDIRYVTPE